MAGNVDFNALKARAIESGLDEEAVTVNTRALIDKVLARYSGEWTVLRELLQNAADASATQVIIKLETLPSTAVPIPPTDDAAASIKHVISHHTVKSLILKNNGIPFSANDWSRLKRIAEGNPDETKIGAFGVGFYSVFSECEEPFVSSGKEAIAFYWKENALFTRRLQLQDQDCSPDTTFVLDYRNTTSPIPALLPLCQFLASSLTFIGLQAIELWLDGWNLLKLSKKIAPGLSVNIPRDVQTKTSEGLMKVQGVTREVVQLDASWMPAVEWKSPTNSSRFEGTRGDDNTSSLRSFFSRLTRSAGGKLADNTADNGKPSQAPIPENLTLFTSSSVFLHINTAKIQTSVGHSFGQELLRATKKPAPKFTSLAVLTSSFASMQLSDESGTSNTKSIFATVLPSKSGRVYIGFPTHQTTGMGAHISAPSIIPTVERESIDLNARWVRTWNTELLRASGIVCRIAWAAEMATIKDRIASLASRSGRTTPQMDDIVPVVPEAAHISNQFVFHQSTPATQVAQVIENSFWTCSQNGYLEVLSTCGVLPTHKIRLAPKDLSFMDSIPVIPDSLMDQSKGFISRIIDFGLITDITVSDIKRELESKPLSAKQLSEFLSWLVEKAVNHEFDRATINALLSVVVANDELDGVPSGILVLRDISSFLNPSRIPADLPIPSSVMPFKYTKNLQANQLSSLGWYELQIDSWVRWLVESDLSSSLPLEQCITRTPSFSARILPIVSKQWDGLSPQSKTAISNLLQQHAVVPTRSGMRKPPEAYFPSVRLFEDLPVVHGLNNVKEKFLVGLGVRKTVDLNVIFERLLGASTDTKEDKVNRPRWSHVELIKYLTTVRSDIPKGDIAKLKQVRFCTAEANGATAMSDKRYRVCELFEPKQSLRDLDMPLLYWPGPYPSGSAEAQFLTLLGLRSYPSAPELVQLIAQAASERNIHLRDKALAYFISTHVINGYGDFDYAKVTLPFLPLEDGTHGAPSQCFTDRGALLFGFKLLRRDLEAHASKFGVKQHPPINDCLNILVREPPKSASQAKELFQYFAKRLAEINSSTADRIGRAAIVPTNRGPQPGRGHTEKKSANLIHIAPQDCYLGGSEDYMDIFDFVDFGAEANLFLLACGSKREPTTVELASMLVKDYARIVDKLQNPEKYLKLLRSIADNMDQIKRDRNLIRDMKKVNFLLASRELPSKTKSEGIDDAHEEEEALVREWQLVKAADAVIVDDYASFSLFKESVLAAPQEEALEDMYVQLGAPNLGSIVVEDVRCGYAAPDQRNAIKLQKQIHERARLFLHDLPKEVIKHDAKWLENHLTVQVVQSISLRRSLRGRNTGHVEKRSAVVSRRQNNSNPILCISPGDINFYQVSQALVHEILLRPKLHSTLTLEMLLKTDLLELRVRGYNVERILRQKAAAAKMAESQRQMQVEEDRRRLEQVEQERQRRQEQELNENENLHPMPGVFPDFIPNFRPNRGADSSLTSSNNDGGMAGFISGLGRRFGLDELLRGGNSAPTDRGSTPSTPPPPYTPQQENNPDNPGPHSGISPSILRQNLTTAITRCRPHGHSAIQSTRQVTQISDAKSYCDEQPGHDLVQVANIADTTLRFFLPRSSEQLSTFYKTHEAALIHFASILMDCASIFGLRKDSISVFCEPNGKTIAFNHQGSIFCNFHYFQNLHLAKVTEGSRADTLVYWWTIFCHELAHNIVELHNSEHSYYT
ncbi:hypothetical protein CPC735_036570 [Coccidioides posadasii C735 delta SOWgp]|uniref:Sacsin/Nov domain-containing protein n=1 Tax=Coccidioides posadasii (strain C735) TaxID=222929 RepID=C5P248_COCP7|nr:hypothetical protein CPC735_036570 [Coccidioides posadasii C735 delta SOWgp]EER28951.1 hypothetical protein CPC735_036570 [Coccidioides posadasii C735 delta SOWgp]|eukprot:XP_003071096.1 hypothetical protein CPC735_036570 [Coccidioides posadasii C735 delta SOWgp]